ncbi:NAD-dependent epimerase/dehydratase family protein [Marvinbryantia formatexigens]|nr:NAD-dependent epimerase/dehydratase family protein [Marvinbryantia formatexigens]UWO23547.1 NAD-dependent epimerase/dehydratase family protein [Marvinbryantia formatexigens DSM 14469]UWO25949.1 NAD-dependent epimerase/dehydratase family protein [Marvinbryantia formatexigens DSM 14469]SDF44226.1 dihydroflavonol-4-reductase [Marvinbryantia formatexigens]SDH36010.1 dihydroflavonol-4-reductase [Marvinbryantia formatexigens]
MEKTMYLVTGAAGFLGSHVCDELLSRGDRVRALVLPGDKSVKYIPDEVEIVEGNLCDMASLENFFTVPKGSASVVIHCASMVTTNAEFNQKLVDVNVGGTRNMIEQCLKHPECKKMVYVSSTGAIPEQSKGTPIRETKRFTPIDEERQVGCYSQTKAMATQAVLDACREKGLKACVVHPSGILGPKDYAIGETTGTVIKIMNGKMPVGMGGSFNLCDVRDLAYGCVAAADKGRIGECYILGNKEVTLKEMCRMLHAASGCRTPYFYVPIGMAYKLAAQMEKKSKKTGEKPLMTNFAVYNLARNNEFDYSKAEKELGYHTRPYEETLKDEAEWLMAEGYIRCGMTEQ